MFDFVREGETSNFSGFLRPGNALTELLRTQGAPHTHSFRFRAFKITFDCVCALIALPLIYVTAAVLLILNPWLNQGPLFFRQERMGQNGKPFQMWKFRTMTSANPGVRSADGKLEEHRITRLGRILRKMRIDELPNFFNVMRGEMSVVGPRPDAFHHASTYEQTLPGYKDRHRVKPGITGLAQVEMGYAEGFEETALKAKYDNLYVARSCGKLELYIIRRTFHVLAAGAGR